MSPPKRRCPTKGGAEAGSPATAISSDLTIVDRQWPVELERHWPAMLTYHRFDGARRAYLDALIDRAVHVLLGADGEPEFETREARVATAIHALRYAEDELCRRGPVE